MIHIMRENDTIEKVSQIFGVNSDDTIKHNTYGTNLLCTEGSSIWIPCESRVEFNEITDERMNYPLNKEGWFNISAIHKPENSDTAFVPADLWGRDLNEMFIDGYIIEETNLNLPYDYPAINACILNNVRPSFAIREPSLYLKDDITQQLLHDLSFKEYEKGLIIADNEEEGKCACELGNALISDGYEISIAGNCRTLTSLKNENAVKDASRVWYMTEKNIFDFDSFETNIKKLLSTVANSDNLGVIYTPRCVKIKKKSGIIEHINEAEIARAIHENDVKKVFFDEDSQLNIFTVNDIKDETYSYVYEDLRSIYAKCAFLKDMKIKNICFSYLDEKIPHLCGAAYIADYAFSSL